MTITRLPHRASPSNLRFGCKADVGFERKIPMDTYLYLVLGVLSKMVARNWLALALLAIALALLTLD